MVYECRVCKEEFDGSVVEHLLTKHPTHPIAKEINRLLSIWCPKKEVN